MHSSGHLSGRCGAGRSVRRLVGGLVCGAVVGLGVVGAAVASPILPVAPVIVAPTLPVVVSPVAPAGVSVSGQVGAIQQDVSELLAPGGAQAGQLSSPLCGYPPASQAFLAWGDGSSYALAPDGDFSTSGEWTLNPLATIVAGGDPYSGAQQSLQLAAGGQAASPAMCVNVDDPTIRFFVRDQGGNGNADVRVDVLYQGRNGNIHTLTIARVRAASSWQPSSVIPIWVNLLAAASPNGTTAVAFVLTAEGLTQNETIGVSSLYVDPFQST
jgi:hypothetical protein